MHMLSYLILPFWRLTFGSSTAQKEAARLHRCAVFVVIGCVTSNKLCLFGFLRQSDPLATLSALKS